jgi:hypothetical protein
MMPRDFVLLSFLSGALLSVLSGATRAMTLDIAEFGVSLNDPAGWPIVDAQKPAIAHIQSPLSQVACNVLVNKVPTAWTSNFERHVPGWSSKVGIAQPWPRKL